MKCIEAITSVSVNNEVKHNFNMFSIKSSVANVPVIYMGN